MQIQTKLSKGAGQNATYRGGGEVVCILIFTSTTKNVKDEEINQALRLGLTVPLTQSSLTSSAVSL